MLLRIDIPLQIVKQLRLDYPSFGYVFDGYSPTLLIDTDAKESLLRDLLRELSFQIARDQELLSQINK